MDIPVVPNVTLQSANAQYIGCFTDNINNIRDLPFEITAASLPSSGNTVEICQSLCAKNGFKFSGNQFG